MKLNNKKEIQCLHISHFFINKMRAKETINNIRNQIQVTSSIDVKHQTISECT